MALPSPVKNRYDSAMPAAKLLHAGAVFTLAMASIGQAQVFGRLVASGTPPTATLGVPEEGEACLQLPIPLTRVEFPPDLTARLSGLQACLQAGEGFRGGEATLQLGETQVRLRLQPGGQAGTFVLSVEAPKPQPAPPPSPSAPPPTPPNPPEPAKPQTEGKADRNPTLPPSREERNWSLEATLQYLPDQKALALSFVLGNPTSLPAVLRTQDIQVFIGGKRLEGVKVDLSFSSGKREWLPPGGSASGKVLLKEGNLKGLFPEGELELRVNVNLLDDRLSVKTSRIIWSLQWYPVAFKGGQP